MRGQHAQRFDRISRAVQNHIGRIEVDAQVPGSRILEKMEQRPGGLLSRLQREGLVPRRGIIANAANHVPHAYVIGVGRILRHESDMRGNAGDSERGREIAALESPLLALNARRRRDEADRPLHRRNGN